MSYVLILIVIIAGLAMVFDQRRRSEIREKSSGKKTPILTEDEAPPTATGKMKIQPVLQALKDHTSVKGTTGPVKDLPEDEEEALPDPFSSGVNKRPEK